MNKIVCLILTASVLFASYGYNGSTTGAVTLVGGIIKAKHIDKEKKYPNSFSAKYKCNNLSCL